MMQKSHWLLRCCIKVYQLGLKWSFIDPLTGENKFSPFTFLTTLKKKAESIPQQITYKTPSEQTGRIGYGIQLLSLITVAIVKR